MSSTRAPCPAMTWGQRRSGSDAEPDESLCRRPGLLKNLGHRLLGVLGERLFEQDVLLEEAVDPALDDLGHRCCRLALFLSRGLGEATLVRNSVDGDLVAGQ